MDVFVYGTLTGPRRVGAVIDSYVFVGPAVLRGLHAVDGRYPTLAPGGDVGGRLLRTDEIQRLDAYEGVDSGLYVRVSVPVVDATGTRDGTGAGGATGAEEATDADAAIDEPDEPDDGDEVAVYVGDPDRLDADATWPGSGAFRERVERYVAENDVTVRRLN